MKADGIIPLALAFDTAGPMATTVREAAMVLTAIAGSDPADRATAEADKRKTDYAALLDAELRFEKAGDAA